MGACIIWTTPSTTTFPSHRTQCRNEFRVWHNSRRSRFMVPAAYFPFYSLPSVPQPSSSATCFCRAWKLNSGSPKVMICEMKNLIQHITSLRLFMNSGNCSVAGLRQSHRHKHRLRWSSRIGVEINSTGGCRESSCSSSPSVLSLCDFHVLFMCIQISWKAFQWLFS